MDQVCRPQGAPVEASSASTEATPHTQEEVVLLSKMRNALDQVRLVDRALHDSVQLRRTPEGARLGSPEYDEWRSARIKYKDEVLAQYRELRSRVDALCPGFARKQAVTSTKLLRRAHTLLCTLQKELDDFSPDEAALVAEIGDHLRSL